MTAEPSQAAAAERPAAIVTGGGRGIGRAIALLLAESGYDLVINDLDADTAAQTAAAARAYGGRVTAVSQDVTAPQASERIIEAAIDGLGRVDAIVNNAGTGLTVPFTDISSQDWERHFSLHVHAAARLCRQAFPYLAASRCAAIVNLSSLAAALCLPHRVAYTSAKSAVEGFTRALAAEWAGHGIRVNAVAPGTITTPLVAENFARGLLDRDKVIERTPLGRLGDAREVATAVRFLLSLDASYITGQTLRVDGGWSIWGGW